MESAKIIKKSSGGRHRVFTNEQRKVRNRQAQAAFRHRRNEHKKTLESTIQDLKQQQAVLEQTALEAIRRAEHSEKRCMALQAAYLSASRALQYLLPDMSGSLATSSASPDSCLSSSPSIEMLSSPEPQEFLPSIDEAWTDVLGEWKLHKIRK
ncbi:hypothetical protein DM01DRAFT_1385244 [Hesseltinella vesiculosa]|uniref:BZIP domain-containing protein n=1 Tax=Hesseltinella vesiculosa TaxID=101127 RepID=A0A1X2GAA3_9FUNG|nr:hypothetical protein DM01DRAFT_1385244 [Hesseltinella vesiculosa]